jgi:hypothetical protein
MYYSEEFKRRVLAAFDSDDVRLRDLLEEGSAIVGRILSDSAEIPYTASEMLELFDTTSFEAVRDGLKKIASREKLYLEWKRQYSREHM